MIVKILFSISVLINVYQYYKKPNIKPSLTQEEEMEIDILIE